MMPGSGNRVFSAPMFPKAVITQPDGTRLTLNAPGAKASTIQYIDTSRARRPDAVDLAPR